MLTQCSLVPAAPRARRFLVVARQTSFNSRKAMLPIRSLLAGAVLAIASTAQTVVIPNGMATAEGSSQNMLPWGRGGGGLLIQTLYDSSHFTAQGITSPIIITGLKWRPNNGTALYASTYTSGCSVLLSTSPTDALAPSATFANNRGVDLTPCYSGVVSWAAQPAQTAPAPFGISVPFTTNFLYDPSLGDLNIECDLPIQTFTGIATPLDVHFSGTAASRVYLSTGYVNGGANATGTVNTFHGVVVEVSYVPAPSLYSNFSANATVGTSPMAVNFTSRSYSSDPGGITAYAWDFDGDNAIDSNAPNPTWVYNACGTYTVSLTVSDATHPAATESKTGYITVDPIGADFTASSPGGFAPAMVNFTDTTAGMATGWAWDFDGDTVVDSNLQNPTWAYAVPGVYSVTLTATNACRSSTRTRTNLITVLAPGATLAPPELLQYQFNEVRGQEVANTASTNAAPAIGAVTRANWWSDPGRAAFRGNEPGFGCLGYRANGAASVDTGWTINLNGSFSVSFWLKRDPASVSPNPIAYVFGDSSFDCRIGPTNIGVPRTGVLSVGGFINFESDFSVDRTPGIWQHLTLVVDDAIGQARWYDNGVPSATIATFQPNSFTYTGPQSFQIGRFSALAGSTLGSHFHLDDFRFYSRALTSTEVMLLRLTAENAASGASGLSCPGALGVPMIGSSGGLPTEGNLGFAVTLSNAEDLKLAAIAMGFAPATFGVFDLSPWLGAGCVLQNDPAVLNFYITSGNAASHPFAIPAGMNLAGMHVYAQWAVLGTVGAASRMLDVNIR